MIIQAEGGGITAQGSVLVTSLRSKSPRAHTPCYLSFIYGAHSLKRQYVNTLWVSLLARLQPADGKGERGGAKAISHSEIQSHHSGQVVSHTPETQCLCLSPQPLRSSFILWIFRFRHFLKHWVRLVVSAGINLVFLHGLLSWAKGVTLNKQIINMVCAKLS